MEKRIVDNPNAPKLKKKEQIKVLKSIIEEQNKIIKAMDAIIRSEDPHSDYNENNIRWIEIKFAQDNIESMQARLNGKTVELFAVYPVLHGEMYSAADM